MPARFIDVVVDPHEELPDGCAVRFQALGEARPVQVLRYAPPLGASGLFRVEGRGGRGAGQPARAATVEIRGQGTATLVWGGNHGLRLIPSGTGAAATTTAWAEPYLLVPPDSIVS